jgi:hypothetical protein
MSVKVKYAALEGELALINDLEIQLWVAKVLESVPEFFWRAPASRSGKFHPPCSNGPGGLVVHTKRAVWIANNICAAWGIFAQERDVVLAACILHDIGKAEDTYPQNGEDHPLHAEKYFIVREREWLPAIENCVRHHMGRWTPRRIAKPICKYSHLELAVYTADYLSSRKELSTPRDTKEAK